MSVPDIPPAILSYWHIPIRWSPWAAWQGRNCGGSGSRPTGAHIGHLGEYFCKEVIRESKELLKKNKVPGKGTHKSKGGIQNVGAYTARAGAS